MNQRRGLGWIRDVPKKADHRFSAQAGLSLPPSIDLWTPPIVDQSITNSCTGNASASLFRYMLRLLNLPDYQPSRLFNYWYGRKISHFGWESEDDGAMPRDVMQSMISNGCPDEADWPFDIARVNEKPPTTLLSKAYKHRIVEGEYVRMLANDNLYHLKASLAKGLPFLIGIPVFTSFFDTGSDGMVADPKAGDVHEGNHLMYVNGYDDSMERFKVPNSWGTNWGDGGVCYLSYDYVRSFGDDFWRVSLIT